MRKELKRHNDSQLNVSVLQRIVPHYRVPFFEKLAARLDTSGIRLHVLHGQERSGTVPYGSRIDAPWARRIPNIYAAFGSFELVWQRGFTESFASDLIIIEQANRLLANYLLHLKRNRSQFRLAYWGHGKNMQARTHDKLAERLKKVLLTRADWWFAYTEISKQHVKQCGFPESKITVVNNTIDDEELRGGLQPHEGAADSTAPIALFCGSLHSEKRLDFLFDAAQRIRVAIPNFELIVVGDGPLATFVKETAAVHPWIRHVGQVTGAERAKYFRLARMILMPGLVGLVIVDSFVAACPMFTTTFPFHSPEIAYLQSGVNGVVTPNDVGEYAREVIRYLSDDSLLGGLRNGCRDAARRYSLSEMVERFAAGVEECLYDRANVRATSVAPLEFRSNIAV